jgi:hypothetical protein
MSLKAGEMPLSCGYVLGPLSLESEFVASPCFDEVYYKVLNEQHHTYLLNEMIVEGELMKLRVYFRGGLLREVSFGRSANPWRQEVPKEEMAAIRYKGDTDWLAQKLGKGAPYEYPWGKIVWSVDNKNLTAYMMILYAEQEGNLP